jgi:CheY-like chemotaxis protein/HPt (histidine-containing phosphotransfer) domain-containing protein
MSVDSAEKGLELLQRQNGPGATDPFNLVLLDWLLPGMNGLDAVTRIRDQQQTRDLPIILMSAHAGKEEEARCIEAGVNVFLPKPITPSSLFDAIVDATGLKPVTSTRVESFDPEEFGGAHILLAEDNETNQFVALEMLGRLGIELEIASNGREAVEMVRQKPYAAVLMDMQMPEMDGLEATRQIRQESAFRDLPIIAMTANAMKSDVEACLSAGMNDFLSKPIERAALVRSLRRWLPASGKRMDTLSSVTPAASQAGLSETGLAAVPVLEGIDVAGAVRRLGIPFERLRPVLLRFLDGQRQTLESLRSAVGAGDPVAARKHAHALAGAAGNLGADDLRQSARALELAAAQEKTDVAELFRQVDRCAGIVFRSIESLRTPSGQPQGPPIKPPPQVDREELRALLERLRSALVDGEVVGSSQVLQELVRLSLPDDYREPIARLQQLIDDYEYDKAAETVVQLLAGSARGGNS